MVKEKILIAADHGGVSLKQSIIGHFSEKFEFIDLGTDGSVSVDYPDYAMKLADEVKKGTADRGVLVCGSAIGISIAANRFSHIRCAVCCDVTMARLAREHNHANVLALGERLIGDTRAFDIVGVFLSTNVDKGERHQRRVEKLSSILD